MGTELSELVVQLSFRAGDSSSQVKRITQEVGGLETSFRAAAAEAGGFTTGLDRAKARASTLTQQLELQKRATEQLKDMMGAAKSRLGEATQAYDAQSKKVEGLRAKDAALRSEISGLESAMKESRAATGDNTEEYIAMSLRLDELNKALADNQKELKAQELQLKKNDGQVAAAERRLQGVTRQYDEARIAQANLQKELDDTNRKLQKHVAQLEDASKKLKTYGDRAKEAGEAQAKLGQGLTAGVTAPVLAAGGASIGAAVGWESSFAGVRKTVEGTPEELARINDELLEMSTNIPTAANELADIGANAGQLGIATGNVTSFTRTIADLKETTNLTAEQGAQDFAKFANITKMPQTQFSNMGSTVVALGNSFATTESDIVALAMNLASSGSQAKMTQAQILGIATGLSSLGLEAQAGGTAFSKVITEMQVAVETGSKDLKEYAKVAGMTSSQFATAFRTDAAGALTQFIAGLSSGSQSAVVMLDKMGITETRMRDALLRASGAGDLLADSIRTATDAWRENVALTNEANVRYQTTESRITMAGNAVKVAAIKFGSEFLPALQEGADIVSDIADRFAALDEQTRKNIITFVGLAAAAGPTIMMIGKGNEAVAAAATGLSKFTGAMASAGGGLKGFLSAVGGALGPVGVAALGAAVLVAGYKWYDYASGAQAAREATEAMIRTAKEWQDTQAATMYDTGNDPFVRFGLEKSQFGGSGDAARDWLERLNQTWTDGKAESKQVVTDYVNEFKAGSDKVREAIEARKKTQEKYGVTGDKTTTEDLQKLKAYDREVEQLLKKRRNGTLTGDDQQRLEQIIQERMEIQLRYTTGEGGGYDSLTQAAEAEKARHAAEGKTAGSDLYGDALSAAAKGYQAQVDALNQSYRDQYADIQAIADESERQNALDQLNLSHKQALAKAQAEYNALVGQYAPEAYQTPEIQKAQEQMETLKTMIAQYNAGQITETQLKTFADSLDEGQLASYLALLKQLQEGGMGNVNLSPEGQPAVTASDLLGGYDTVAEFLEAHAGTFEGLAGMLGAAGDEANRVLMDLGLTPEGETLKAWIDEHKEFQMTGTLTGLPESVVIDATMPVTLTNLPDTITVDATSPVTLTGVPDSLTIDADAPVTITGLPDGPLTIPANSPTTLTGLPDRITVEADAPVTLSGVPESLTVNAEAQVTLTDLPESVGIPSAVIQDVVFAEGVNAPALEITAKPSFDFSALDKAALDAYYAQNPDAKPSVVMDVGLKQGWAELIKEAYDSGNLRVFGDNGAELKVTPSLVKQIGPTDIFLGGETDENGNMVYSVLVTPKLGTAESVEQSGAAMQQVPQNFLPDSLKSSAMDKVTSITSLSAGVKELTDAGEELMSQQGKAVLLDQLVSLSQSGDDLESIGSHIAVLMAALSSDELDSDQAAQVQEQLNAMLEVVRLADEYLGVGNDISAGIASGMKAYGWSGDATTAASSIESALRTALESQSPAQKLVPIGSDAAAGVGQGLAAYSFAADAAKAAAGVSTAMETALSLTKIGIDAGKDLMNGVIAGLADKKDDALRKAKEIADAIKDTIRKAWDINSPSREGAWLGGMLIEGVGRGMDARIPDVVARLNQLEIRATQSAQTVGGGDTIIQGGIAVEVRVDSLDGAADIRATGQALAAEIKREINGVGG